MGGLTTTVKGPVICREGWEIEFLHAQSKEAQFGVKLTSPCHAWLQRPVTLYQQEEVGDSGHCGETALFLKSTGQ